MNETWSSHLLDRVLALGLKASAVVGPFARRGSKDPGCGRSPASGMRVIEGVLAPASLCRAGDVVSPLAGSLGLACGFLPGSGFAGGWFGPGLRVGWVVLRQQGRLPLHLFRRLSRLLSYAGCRVGEASHPGPGASTRPPGASSCNSSKCSKVFSDRSLRFLRRSWAFCLEARPMAFLQACVPCCRESRVPPALLPRPLRLRLSPDPCRDRSPKLPLRLPLALPL